MADPLDYADKLDELSDIYLKLAGLENISNQDRLTFNKLSDEFAMQGNSIRLDEFHKNTERLNALSQQLDFVNDDLNREIKKLKHLETQIQAGVITLQIIANIVQIGAKLAKYAA